MENIYTFLKEAKFINHVNFSGMNLGKPQVMKLMVELDKCPFLLGVHLTDNDITKQPYFYDIMKHYKISSTDLKAINRDNTLEKPMHNENNKETDYKSFLA